MGFKKSDIVREIKAVLVYPQYFERDDDGKPKLDPKTGERIPIRFKFPFAVERKSYQDLLEAEQQLGGGRKFGPVEKLARLLIAEPEGFDDFPADARPLDERVREFFTGMEGWAEDALNARFNAIYPTQLFPVD